MHTANIKVKRKDKYYEFGINMVNINYHKSNSESALMQLYDEWDGDYVSHIRTKLYRNVGYWESELNDYGFKNFYFETGVYTIETKHMNVDILNKGMFIFVDSLDKYCEVVKIEVNSDSSVNYYIDHIEYFDEESSNMRVEAVEKWFEFNYPELDRYEQLINHKDDVDDLMMEFNKYQKIANDILHRGLTKYGLGLFLGLNAHQEVLAEEPVKLEEEQSLYKVDSDDVYVEVKANHYRPKVEIVNEGSSSAIFSVIMIIALIVSVIILCAVGASL